MNNFLSGIAAIALLSALASCSTTRHGGFTPIAVNDGQSVLYIYRPASVSNVIYSPDIFINGEVWLSIKNAKSRHLTLNPGQYRVEVEPDKKYAGATRISLNLDAGKTVYLRVDTKLEIKSSVKYEPYQRSFSLTKVEAALAITEIAECCTDDSKKEILGEQETGAENKKDEFSVDKTQNPFSH